MLESGIEVTPRQTEVVLKVCVIEVFGLGVGQHFLKLIQLLLHFRKPLFNGLVDFGDSNVKLCNQLILDALLVLFPVVQHLHPILPNGISQLLDSQRTVSLDSIGGGEFFELD